MGNLALCGRAPAVKPSPPPPVARVLLIDGSMLKVRSPITVINLLLDYPHHVICPLDSLKPGLHSLSRLLPDDKLQLGRLYLLLPYKAPNQPKSLATSKLPKQTQKGQLLQEGAREPLQAARGQKQTTSRRKLNVGTAKREESDMGFAEPGEGIKGNVQLHETKRSAEKVSGKNEMCESSEKKGRYAFLQKSDMGSCRRSDPSRRSDVGGRQQQAAARRLAGSAGSERTLRELSRRKKCGRQPLCNTPELQRAYRSLRLRRPTSWTPRLQPILERQ